MLLNRAGHSKFFPALFIALILTGCDQKKKEPVLELGNYQLSAEQMERIVAQLPADQKEKYFLMGEEAQQQFLKDYAEKQLLVLEARERRMDSDAAVRTSMQMAENMALFNAMYKQEVLNKIVPEQEIQNYYKQNLAQFTQPSEILVRHIVVTPRKESKISNTSGEDALTVQDAVSKIQDLAVQIQSGVPMEELAKQYSEDKSAASGGMLGWIKRGQMVEAFEAAAFQLGKGQISRPVQTPFGFHLIQVMDRRNDVILPYEIVRDAIQLNLARGRAEQENQTYKKLVEDLRKRFPQKIHSSSAKKSG